MGQETDYRFFIEAVPGWLEQVANLLECLTGCTSHHRPEEFYLVKMFGDAGWGTGVHPLQVDCRRKDPVDAWPD